MRLATEADGLLLDYEKEWTPSWYEAAGVRDAEFHRGFIECVTLSWSAFVDFGYSIFTEAPIRHLDIVDLGKADELELFVEWMESGGFLGRMISLRLDGQELEDKHMEHLNRRGLSQIRWLSLHTTTSDTRESSALRRTISRISST